MRTRKWQGQDGQDRYTTEIVGSEMQMLDSRGQVRQVNSQDQTIKLKIMNFQINPAQRAARNQSLDAFDDDIPFKIIEV